MKKHYLACLLCLFFLLALPVQGFAVAGGHGGGSTRSDVIDQFPIRYRSTPLAGTTGEKKCLSIMTLQETLKWGEYPVQIVALVAISQDEAKEFNDFFEMFIEIVSDPINVRLLAGAENFTEFILKMKMLVETEE